MHPISCQSDDVITLRVVPGKLTVNWYENESEKDNTLALV